MSVGALWRWFLPLNWSTGSVTRRELPSCRLMPECQCYPSMDILAVATEEYLSSALDNNLDIAEIGLFLAVVKDRQQLTTLGLGECVTCYTQLHNSTRKLGSQLGRSCQERPQCESSVTLPDLKSRSRPGCSSQRPRSIWSSWSLTSIPLMASSWARQLFGRLFVLWWAREVQTKVIRVATMKLERSTIYLLNIYIDNNNLVTSVLPRDARIVVTAEVEAD